MKNKEKKAIKAQESGFTLTEMLLSVAILGILFTVIPVLLLQMTKLQRQNEARIEIQREARVALDLVNRQLRQAQAASVTIDRVSNQPFCSRIQFTKEDGNSVNFHQNGTNLNMMVSGSTTTIAKNLLYMAFTYPATSDRALISVSLTTQKATYNQEVKNLQLSVEKVRLMND